jgi:hypothetical protein
MMNNKHWEAALSDAVKEMKPVEPSSDLRAGVMHRIRSMEAARPVNVRPLLSATIRKIILISIPALMAAALLLSPPSAESTGSIFDNRLDFIPEITLPALTCEMSDTFKLALIAVLMFAFLQVVNIGRLINKADKGLH